MEESEIIRDSHGFWCMKQRDRFCFDLLLFLTLSGGCPFSSSVRFLLRRGFCYCCSNFRGLSQYQLMEIESTAITIFLPFFASSLPQLT